MSHLCEKVTTSAALDRIAEAAVQSLHQQKPSRASWFNQGHLHRSHTSHWPAAPALCSCLALPGKGQLPPTLTPLSSSPYP